MSDRFITVAIPLDLAEEFVYLPDNEAASRHVQTLVRRRLARTEEDRRSSQTHLKERPDQDSNLKRQV